MNNVCILYSDGRKERCSYFPDDKYNEGIKSGKIKRVRKLTAFDKLVVTISNKFNQYLGG